MTYKEWMTRTLARFNMTVDDAELILASQTNIIPDPEEPVNAETAKKALVLEFSSILPLHNVSEGGFSISWKWEALKAWYYLTAREVGIDPVDLDAKPAPKIRNKSSIW